MREMNMQDLWNAIKNLQNEICRNASNVENVGQTIKALLALKHVKDLIYSRL
jgi:hypothetical protein